MPTHLALIALLVWPFPSHAAHTQPRVQTRFGAWTLNVRTDAFTGGHVCKLSQPKVDYLRQAVVLHLSPRTDTTGAVYRIDAGAPLLASVDDATIAGLGFALHNDDLANPSGGLVRVPASRLAGAKTIHVETGAFGRATLFKIDGLSAALAAAKAAGCGEGDFR
jgi:hypothetical protein